MYALWLDRFLVAEQRSLWHHDIHRVSAFSRSIELRRPRDRTGPAGDRVPLHHPEAARRVYRNGKLQLWPELSTYLSGCGRDIH